jgi:hypothetical protein
MFQRPQLAVALSCFGMPGAKDKTISVDVNATIKPSICKFGAL